MLQHSEKVLQRTEEALQQLNPAETTLQTLTQVSLISVLNTKCKELNSNISLKLTCSNMMPVGSSGDVGGLGLREDEGGLPGWGESAQCLSAELQRALVEQGFTDWFVGDPAASRNILEQVVED